MNLAEFQKQARTLGITSDRLYNRVRHAIERGLYEDGLAQLAFVDMLLAEPEHARPAPEAERFVASCCDAADDRMYHAEDGTWWKRVGYDWSAANPPPGWMQCPPDMDARGLAEAHGKLNPELGMPESRGNVETGDLTRCPCPACGKMINVCEYYLTIRAGQKLHCDHCNAWLRVEYATVTLSEEAGRHQ